jgi:ribose transport system substrate-binding protein
MTKLLKKMKVPIYTIMISFLTIILFLAMFSSGVFAQDNTTLLVTVIRALDCEYHIRWAEGAEAFAASTGLKHVVSTCGGNSEKQLNDIKALIAKTGGNVVFNIDPNEGTDCYPIAKTLNEAKVYFFTWWNKPHDLDVTGFDYWAGHSVFNGVDAGYYGATELFKTFKTPNKGKIIAVQGRLANTIAQDLFKGLEKALAENPDVELVANQTANWNRTEAFNLVSSLLVAHPDIDGIWCANDDMSMGIIEALRAAGLAGKVKVCGFNGTRGFIEAIAKGETAATTFTDAFYQGGIGLSICLAAKEGKLDISSLPKEKRSWYSKPIYVNSENVSQVLNDYMEKPPQYDWDDYYKLWAGGMN